MIHSRKTISLLICSAALLLLLCACGSAKEQYIDEVNAKLVSFTDCANAFSDSIEAIADSRKVPTAAQIDEIERRMDNLFSVCGQLKAINAPKACADEQAALTEAMGQYTDALQKCRALLEFYRGYDAEIRSYPTPDEGSAAMETKLSALYSDFAEAMWQARASFREAQTKLEEN